LKKFKHTNEELELAKIQTEKDKKKKESEEKRVRRLILFCLSFSDKIFF